MKTKLLATTIALIAVLAIGTSQAFSEEVTINTPWDIRGQGCYLDEDDPNVYHCDFRKAFIPTEGGVIEEPSPDEKVIDPETGELITTEEPEPEPAKPLTPAEKEIEKLQKKLVKDGKLPSHDGQLLMALLSLQKECELGTEEAAPIQNYEVFTVATFEPYTHTDLGTQYILKEIELAIQECQAQKILKEKVLGPQYLDIPGKDDVNPPHEFRSDFDGLLWDDLEGLDNPTYAFEERHMTEFNFDKSAQFAEDFKCSAVGKSMGMCRDPFTGPAPLEDVVTKSAEGKAIQSKWKAYLETGETVIPKQDPDEEPNPTSALEAYANAYNMTNAEIQEWLDKRIEAGK